MTTWRNPNFEEVYYDQNGTMHSLESTDDFVCCDASIMMPTEHGDKLVTECHRLDDKGDVIFVPISKPEYGEDIDDLDDMSSMRLSGFSIHTLLS